MMKRVSFYQLCQLAYVGTVDVVVNQGECIEHRLSLVETIEENLLQLIEESAVDDFQFLYAVVLGKVETELDVGVLIGEVYV